MVERPVRCSQCGRLLRTLLHAAPVRRAPVICRDCFGMRSYEGDGGQSLKEYLFGSVKDQVLR